MAKSEIKISAERIHRLDNPRQDGAEGSVKCAQWKKEKKYQTSHLDKNYFIQERLTNKKMRTQEFLKIFVASRAVELSL